MNLEDRIASREAVVAVVGLGYVGLPLATVFSEAGFRVIGVDQDAERVASVNIGESYIEDVPSETLRRTVSHTPHRLSATTDYDALSEADAVIICVPTPLSKTKDPDVSHIASAAEDVAKRLRPGMLVVLESTSYPGTTEELVLPRLQSSAGRSFTAGEDFYLAFSPERIDPGRTDRKISNTPKVIAGMTPRCLEVGKALYSCIVEELVPVSSPETAEMVKLLENTFRATNVALVNEVAIICDHLGVDAWEVIEAAGTKPFGFMTFYPGPGLGGHCIPVDPHFLAWKLKTLDYNARFIHLAEEINLSMPLHWVNKMQDALNEVDKPVKGSNILVLGVSYKRDVADTRESPAFDIIDLVLEKGGNVTFHDPHIRRLETEDYRMASITDDELPESLESADCVIIVTDHSNYDWEDVRRRARLIVDTRNALGGPWTKVQATVRRTATATADDGS